MQISESNKDKRYKDKIENISFKPIFIMGLPRSGTSILYKTLDATQCFNVVTAYHLIKYEELLYNHINKIENGIKDNLSIYFKGYSQSDRGIDQLHISPNFPEEYRFLLERKTGQQRFNKKSKDLFMDLCKKIQFISKNNKPILLKNPYDFTNFLYIKKVFPDTKFVFIHRNPLNTLNSQIKAMRTLLRYKSHYMALLSPWYNNLFDNKTMLYYYRFLYSHYTPIRSVSAVKKMVESTNFFLENIDNINKKNYINVTYEELCKKPNEKISDIMKFLNLETKQKIRFDDYISPRKTVLLKEIQKKKKYINRKMNKYLSYFGYSL